MEKWESEARESIRDLVARYNANADTGRYAQVIELFAPDAVMEVGDDRLCVGHDEILALFTRTQGLLPSEQQIYVRHFTSTHQIDVIDWSNATGRCYYQVLTAVGLDHWGRYLDFYRTVDGRWRFAQRCATLDGWSPGALFGLGQA